MDFLMLPSMAFLRLTTVLGVHPSFSILKELGESYAKSTEGADKILDFS